jgi:hypothetical protein
LNDKIKVSLSQSSGVKKQIKSKVENAFYEVRVYLTMTINDRFILNACAGLRLVIAGDIYIIIMEVKQNPRVLIEFCIFHFMMKWKYILMMLRRISSL